MPCVRDLTNLPSWNSCEDGSRGYIGIYHCLRTHHCPLTDGNSWEEERIRSDARASFHDRANQFVSLLSDVFVVCEDAAGAEEYSVLHRRISADVHPSLNRYLRPYLGASVNHDVRSNLSAPADRHILSDQYVMSECDTISNGYVRVECCPRSQDTIRANAGGSLPFYSMRMCHCLEFMSIGKPYNAIRANIGALSDSHWSLQDRVRVDERSFPRLYSTNESGTAAYLCSRP